METVHSLDDFTYKGPVFLTQGTFDGVHLGHQKILNRLVESAKNEGGKSVLLTFYPHPRLVLYPEDNELMLITTLEEKATWLRHFGIDYLIVLPFTRELSRQKPFDFVRLLTDCMQIRRFVIGYDHRFGRNREGSIEDMHEYSEIFNFEVDEIAEQDVNDCIVSSSKIRTSILEGDVQKARDFLGRPFDVSGKVVEGRKVGGTLGYPTANIKVTTPYKIMPKTGVYAVEVEVSSIGANRYHGMLNLGRRPTFELTEKTLEVHIFDFSEKIYGQEIKVFFVGRLREEIKFADASVLETQLKEDEIQARKMLSNI
jgi:riboflavin kinase / FMN adenylyltransferase